MILDFVKQLVPKGCKKLLMDSQMAPFRLAALERKVEMLASQSIRNIYAPMGSNISHLPHINRHEFSVYSQNGEDGILLFIFSIIGTSSRRFIEFGIGDGRECNSANLLVNFGWRGALLDCMPEFVVSARRHYDHVLRDRVGDVTIKQVMITAENVNEVLREYVSELGVDLVTIDIDGNDYWVWKSLEVCKPRVYVIEYSAVMGSEKAITVQYDPSFSRFDKHPSGLYAGASLPALIKLGKEKGYTFVGCNSHGVNAFFVRDDLMALPLEVMTAEQGYYAQHLPGLIHISPEDFEQIRHMPFCEV